MAETFLISDTHFGHVNVCKFLRSDGTKLRPWDDVDEMDEVLCNNWNKVVHPNDKVYHLGDVCINRKSIKTLARLNGTKILVRGNHDIFNYEEYAPYFKDIRGTHKLDNFILSHIPIHPDSVARWAKGNIHGHLHDGRVMDRNTIDPRYVCVSVENINYTPISFDEIVKGRFK